MRQPRVGVVLRFLCDSIFLRFPFQWSALKHLWLARQVIWHSKKKWNRIAFLCLTSIIAPMCDWLTFIWLHMKTKRLQKKCTKRCWVCLNVQVLTHLKSFMWLWRTLGFWLCDTLWAKREPPIRLRSLLTSILNCWTPKSWWRTTQLMCCFLKKPDVLSSLPI